MTGILRLKVCCLVFIGSLASCSSLIVRPRTDRAVKTYAFQETHNFAELQAPVPPEQHSSARSINDGATNASPLDMSCILSGDDWGSSAASIKSTWVASREDCFKECRANPQCSHFTYNRQSETCFLKALAPTFYKSTADETGSASCDTSCFVSGVSYMATPLMEFEMTGRLPTDCQAACFGTEGCRAFAWIDTHCALFGAGFSAFKVEVEGATAGPRDFCDRGGSLTSAESMESDDSAELQAPMPPEQQSSGHSINDGATNASPLDMSCILSGDDWGSSTASIKSTWVASREDCFKECRANPQCSHFTYNRQSETCFLKALAPTFYKSTADETGSASCDTSCFVSGVSYMATPLMEFEMTGRLPTDCQAACFGTEGCRAFAWIDTHCALFGAGFSAFKVEVEGATAGPRDFCDRGGSLTSAESMESDDSAELQAPMPPEQQSSGHSINDGATNASPLDMSCILSGDDWGSSAASIKSTWVASREDCFKECRANPQCSHFTYNRQSETCFLKALAPTFYKSTADETGSASCDTSCFVSGVSYMATPLMEFEMTGRLPTDCQAACFGTEGCRAFAWIDTHCALFGAGFSAFKVEVEGATAGPRDFCDRGGSLTSAESMESDDSAELQAPMPPEQQSSGHSINDGATNASPLDMSCILSGDDWGSSTASIKSTWVASREDCFKECRANPQCSHFTYNRQSETCFLKALAPTFYKSTADETGSASCDTSCFVSGVSYMVTPLMEFEMTGRLPTDCQAACFGTEGCRAFAWIDTHCALFGAGFSAFKVEVEGATAGPRDFCDRGGSLTSAESMESDDSAELQAPMPPEQQSSGHSINDGATNASPLDMSCILSGDDWGSSTASIKSTWVASREDCFKECRANPQCSHFTYNRQSETCFLKALAPTFYKYTADETGSASCDTSCFVSGVSYMATPLMEFEMTGRLPTDCQAACFGTEGCRAFAWIDTHCALFGAGFSAFKVEVEGATAGPRDFCDRGGSLTSAESMESDDSAELQAPMPPEQQSSGHSINDGATNASPLDMSCILSGDDWGSSTASIKSTWVASREDCFKECRANPQCSHFTYNRQSETCFLKALAPTFYKSTADETGSASCDTSCFVSGVSYMATPLMEFEMTGRLPTDCQAACFGTEGCRAFAWIDTHCALFGAGFSAFKVEVEGATAGPRDFCDRGGSLTSAESMESDDSAELQAPMPPEQQSSGHSINDGATNASPLDMSCILSGDDWGSSTASIKSTWVASREDCFKECRANPQCSHFTYNRQSETCFLKALAPTFYKYTADETGSASCDTSCFVSGVSYMATPLMEFEMTGRLPTDCQAACFGTEGCRAFAWIDTHCALFGAGFSAFKVEVEGATAGPRDFCDRGGSLTSAESMESDDSAELQAPMPPEQQSSGHSINDGATNASPLDMSCILSGDDWGSSTASIKSTWVASREDCFKECRANPQCSHFTYNRQSETCFLKALAPTFYKYTADETGSASCDTSCFVSGVSYMATPLMEFEMTGRLPTDCQAACFGTEGCRAFAWIDTHCALFGAGFSAFKVEVEGATAGPRDFCDRGGSLTSAESMESDDSAELQAPMPPEQQSSGHSINDGATNASPLDMSCILSGDDWGSSTASIKSTWVASREDCFKECRANPQCSHFTYNRQSETCFLKALAPTFYKSTADETGSASCDTSCFVSGVSYMATPLMEFEMTGRLPTDCQAACFGTEGCRAFAWIDTHCALFGAGFSAFKVEVEGATAGPRDFCDRGGSLTSAESMESDDSAELQAPMPPEQQSSGHSINDGATNASPLDMSCILSGDDWGSSTASIKSTWVASREDCFKECRANPQCSHFTYNRQSETCFLKALAPTFYKYTADETGSASCDTSCFVSGVSYMATPLMEFEMTGRLPTDCQAACFGTEGCRAFAWIDTHCALFGAGFSAFRVDVEGTTVGPRDFCDRGGSLTLAELRDGGGNERCIKAPNVGSSSRTLTTVQVSFLGDCIIACSEEPECSHFTYKPKDNICYLKEGDTEYEFTSEAVTGSRDCDIDYVQEWPKGEEGSS